MGSFFVLNYFNVINIYILNVNLERLDRHHSRQKDRTTRQYGRVLATITI